MVADVSSKPLSSAGIKMVNKRLGICALRDDQAERHAGVDMKVRAVIKLKIALEIPVISDPKRSRFSTSKLS